MTLIGPSRAPAGRWRHGDRVHAPHPKEISGGAVQCGQRGQLGGGRGGGLRWVGSSGTICAPGAATLLACERQCGVPARSRARERRCHLGVRRAYGLRRRRLRHKSARPGSPSLTGQPACSAARYQRWLLAPPPPVPAVQAERKRRYSARLAHTHFPHPTPTSPAPAPPHPPTAVLLRKLKDAAGEKSDDAKAPLKAIRSAIEESYRAG